MYSIYVYGEWKHCCGKTLWKTMRQNLKKKLHLWWVIYGIVGFSMKTLLRISLINFSEYKIELFILVFVSKTTFKLIGMWLIDDASNIRYYQSHKYVLHMNIRFCENLYRKALSKTLALLLVVRTFQKKKIIKNESTSFLQKPQIACKHDIYINTRM